MTEKKPPAPISLDVSFLTPLPAKTPATATPNNSAPANAQDLSLELTSLDLDDSDEGEAILAQSPSPLPIQITPTELTSSAIAPQPLSAASPIHIEPIHIEPIPIQTDASEKNVQASLIPNAPIVLDPPPPQQNANLQNLGLNAGDLDDSDEGAPVQAQLGQKEATPDKKEKKKSKIFSKDGLEALDLSIIPEKYHKHLDPNSPPPMRLAAARAMVPMGPKDMVHVVYQCIFDVDPKISKFARQSFKKLDEKVLKTVLSDVNTAPPVLNLLVQTRLKVEKDLEALVLNRATPDTAFIYLAEHAEFHAIIAMVASNQERSLRCHDIVRSLKINPNALRSELDRTIDFMVREGVFLEDMQEFEDSFVRLGKNEMLTALKKVEIKATDLTEEQLRMAAAIGVSPEEFLLGGSQKVEELENQLKAKAELENAQKAPVPMGQKHSKEEEETEGSQRRKALASYSIPLQVKMAMIGDHSCALEALKSNNRMVASAGIRNPQIRESDVPKIVYSKSMHDDVIRYICNNRDWIKGYAVKKGLIMNPKTPISLVLRWLPMLRPFDLKSLAKSKQVPSAVSIHAKRLLASKTK